MCFENVSCKAIYSGKIMFGMIPDDVGFVPNLGHYCRKLVFLMLLKP